MHDVWQDLIVIAVVAVAGMYLIVRAAGIFRKRSGGCGSGCSSCPSANESKAPKLVSIELGTAGSSLKKPRGTP